MFESIGFAFWYFLITIHYDKLSVVSRYGLLDLQPASLECVPDVTRGLPELESCNCNVSKYNVVTRRKYTQRLIKQRYFNQHATHVNSFRPPVSIFYWGTDSPLLSEDVTSFSSQH